MNIEVSVDIDGKKLSFEEARKLYIILKELFEKETVTYPVYPYPAFPTLPSYPTWAVTSGTSITTNSCIVK